MGFLALIIAALVGGAAVICSAQHVELQQALAGASGDGSNLTALVSEYYNAQMTALSQLRAVVEQLPQRLESALSDKLSQQLSKQVRSMIVDPTQAAVLRTTLAGTSNPFASRMVHFKGADLLVVAPKNDEFVGGHILATGQPWAPEVLGALMDLVKPGSVVLDVGANLGSYSIFLAHATGPKGRVYSFEPQRKMFQLTCTNAMVNGLTNMLPQNVALSFEAGEASMSDTVPDGASVGNKLDSAEQAGMRVNYGGMALGVGGEKVRAMTLDSYNLDGVSLIKVDIQGAEKLFFYGAQETIKRNLPSIAYEYTPDAFAISADMNATLHVPDRVHAFNITAFLLELGYGEGPKVSGDDVFMLPPGHTGTHGRKVFMLPPGHPGNSRRKHSRSA